MSRWRTGRLKGMSHNVFLIGFSGTGKSVVGRRLARLMKRQFVDTDDEIVSRAGRPIPEIFANEGEGRFRAWERAVLEDVCQRGNLVVSTGGGVVLDPHNRNLMMGSGAVICLEAKPATVFGRLRRHITNGGSARERPLLAGEDPLKRIEALKEYRHPFYGMADWTVHTDDLTTEEIIDEVVKGVGYANRRFERPSEKWPVFPPPSLKGCQSDAPYGDEMGAAFAVDTASAKYPVFVGWGILDQLGRRMRELGMKGTAAIIGDEKVMALHNDGVQESLREAGFQALSLSVPSGEGSKSHDELWKIYDWLVEHRIERGSTIVAMGGGVVGDLAGYAAATYLRGINLVQVPTTLVAMTDSAIGGKVAINHPQGKNLIGAFYQPKMMLADVGLLSSLPARELTSGWAETIKHGVIMDPELLHLLEQDHQRISGLERERTTEVVMRSAALKGKVVSKDERESDLRMILNFGHTIGHSLEAATGYGQYLHGEAVAVGMMGAAIISHRVAGLPHQQVERLENLLKKYRLPTSLPDVSVDRLLQGMTLDKKVRGKTLRWVLVQGIGETVIRDDVPLELVRDVLAKLRRAA